MDPFGVSRKVMACLDLSERQKPASREAKRSVRSYCKEIKFRLVVERRIIQLLF